MNQHIKETIALDSGDEDVYGHAIEHMFGIAETLYATGESLPPEWEFHDPWPRERRLQLIEDGEDGWASAEYLAILRKGLATADDLRHAGAVLTRYITRLKRAGLDY